MDLAFHTSCIDGGDPVPEPAGRALMIAGFGLAGAGLRQRRTNGALAL